MYDIIVVGSGPAGAAAALKCLSFGLKTLVICKSKREANKDDIHATQTIHPGTVSLLADLKIQNIIDYSSVSSYTGIWVNDVYQPLSNEQDIWEGFHLNKIKFDAYLYYTLKKAKISVIDDEVTEINETESNNFVSVKTSKGKVLKAYYVIDGTGPKRKLGRLLKLRELLLSPPITVFAGVSYNKISSSNYSRTEFKFQPHGWMWVAPESSNRFTWTKSIVDKQETFNIPFKESILLSNVEYHNMRWRVFRPVCKNRILLCGDAAGSLDPSSGQGIFNALLTGITVGTCVAYCMRNPVLKDYFFAHYDNWFINQFEQNALKLNNYYKEYLNKDILINRP